MGNTFEFLTNAGNFTTNKKVILPIYQHVWFHEEATTNVLGVAKVANKFQVVHSVTKMTIPLNYWTINSKQSQ